MEKFDLQPLTKEAIQQKGLDNHDLWMVKMADEILGPFELESLKQYAADHEPLFDKLFASRVENNDFQPFFSHAQFQRREPQVVATTQEIYKGPFWIMNQGLKSAPLSQQEINKRIEMGLLTMTDLISCDNGHD